MCVNIENDSITNNEKDYILGVKTTRQIFVKREGRRKSLRILAPRIWHIVPQNMKNCKNFVACLRLK